MSAYLFEFGALALAHFLALLSPGPDFFLIVGTSVRHGHRRAAGACLGIALANGVYILSAVAGLSLLREGGWLYLSVKSAGAAFLIYLGWQLLKTRQRDLCGEGTTTRLDAESTQVLLVKGFLSAILNPKNAIFYLSLMALIVSPETPPAVQILYGLWMFAIVLLWDLALALCIGNSRMREALDRHTHRIEKLSGIVLLGLGMLVVIR